MGISNVGVFIVIEIVYMYLSWPFFFLSILILSTLGYQYVVNFSIFWTGSKRDDYFAENIYVYGYCDLYDVGFFVFFGRHLWVVRNFMESCFKMVLGFGDYFGESEFRTETRKYRNYMKCNVCSGWDLFEFKNQDGTNMRKKC